MRTRRNKTFCYFIIFVFAILMLSIFPADQSFAQHKSPYMRIARVIVDSAQLENYKAALKEGMHAAVTKEPGVLSLNAVYDKKNPTHVTVFEVYADEDAYQQHIQTAHFKKYKNTVANMVTSLELIDVEPIALESKPK